MNPFFRRLLTALGILLAILVCLSFVAIGWGLHYLCPAC